MVSEPIIEPMPAGYRLMHEGRMIVEISKDRYFVRLESDPYEGMILVPMECLPALIAALGMLEGPKANNATEAATKPYEWLKPALLTSE